MNPLQQYRTNVFADSGLHKGAGARRENHAVHRFNAEVLQLLRELGEGTVEKREAGFVRSKIIADRLRIRVLVDAKQATLTIQSRQDLPAVTSPTKGPVHVDPTGCRYQSIDRLS